MSNTAKSLFAILGPWVEPEWDSGLIDRCRRAWNKELQDLSREELATLLREGLAFEYLLPVATRKLSEPDDDTEMFDGELAEVVQAVSRIAEPSAASNRRSTRASEAEPGTGGR